MPNLSHSERLDRLERVAGVLAEDQESLRKTVGSLATKTRQAFDRVAEMFAETDRRMRETDQHMRETDQRLRESSRALDERIDKLVAAIGELIRRQN
jgi:hypothetical protein